MVYDQIHQNRKGGFLMNNNKIVFKNYNMEQLQLPMDLSEDIPENHVVRVVNEAIEQLNDEIFLKQYPGGGSSSYHPKMMTKIPIIDEVFTSVLELLINEGYVKYENYFLDGTKIEANANKYSFVWKKSTDKYEANLQAKIKELLKEIEEEPKNKKLKKAAKTIKKDYLPRTEKYENYQSTFGTEIAFPKQIMMLPS